VIDFLVNYVRLISKRIVLGFNNIFDISVFNEECIQELALLHLINKRQGPRVSAAVLNDESGLVVFIPKAVMLFHVRFIGSDR